MQYTDKVASGFWITPLLRGWGRVGGTVPRGFEAYARVFHPAETRRVIVGSDPLEVETRRVRWAEVAAARGTALHPEAQWGAVSGSQYDEHDWGDGWMLSPPEQGRLALDQLAAVCELLALHTITPGNTVVGIWNGWGDLHPGSGTVYLSFTRIGDEPDPDAQQERADAIRDSVSDEVAHAATSGPTLELPGRGYVLLTADVREFTDPNWVHTAGLGWFFGHGPTPNILWPGDHAWFLASEIDFDSTLVAGTRALIDAIVGHPQLEAVEATEDADQTIAADRVNPPASS